LIDFPVVGTLEAFNTDGLRTLARTIGAPNMKEKTLRYPGHVEKMRLLRECGFFAADPVDVAGQLVRPVDLTARLLFPMWQLAPGEGDLTVRMIAQGLYREEGISPPEYLGRDARCVDFLLAGLAEREVLYREQVD
jgi:saccharopine dehydrogenase-like NADP-dependent oxidoreductase